MILIDALFIANNGGGPNLLRYLLDRISELSLQSRFFLLLDERFQHDVSGFASQRMAAGLVARRIFYKQHKHKFSRIFCFVNTPPPVKLAVPVDTYFHNQMLLESTRHLLDKKYWRFYLRYIFVKLYNGNTDNYIVQTTHMVNDIVAVGLKKKENVKTYPFYQVKTLSQANKTGSEFVYISSPSFYKNHDNLLKAWEILYTQGLTPTLHLTVEDWAPGLITEIERLVKKGLKIVNHGYTNPLPLYSKCTYLIYPSSNESFGLGLIEAAKAGLKILAADLPYVRSVISPSAVFNPKDPDNIAFCVSNALKNALPFPEILVNDEVDALIKHLIN